MPYQRKNSNNWYTKIRLPGVGKIRRSLETESKGRAEKLETAIRELHGRPGGIEILKAFADGAELNGRKVSAHDLYEAWAKGQPGELLERLKEKPVPTLADAWSEVLRLDAADTAATTRERYEGSFANLEAFHGPDTPVNEVLTNDAVKAFKAHRLKQGVAKQTVNNDLGVVSLLATRALEKGWIERRPTIDRYKYRPRLRYLEPAELKAYMEKLTPEYRPLMRLLVGSGLRLGEAIGPRKNPSSGGLRAGDVQGTTLHVRKHAKAGSTRPVHVAAELAAEVAEREPGPDGRLFPHVRRRVQTAHNEACEAAKIEDYTIHDHRHTYAVARARAGMPLGTLQKQLGHKTIQMTMRYASFHPDYSDVAEYEDRVADRYGLNGAGEDGEDVQE